MSKKVEIFNEVLATMKTEISYLDNNRVSESLLLIQSVKDIEKFSNQINIDKLAAKHVSVLESVELFSPLYTCLIGEENVDDSIYLYIELLYKASVNKKKYNQYLNEKDKYDLIVEMQTKKKAQKQMKKIMPLLQKVFASVDKTAIKELMALFDPKNPNKKLFETMQDIMGRLMRSGMDFNEAFKDYDISSFGMTEEEATELFAGWSI